MKKFSIRKLAYSFGIVSITVFSVLAWSSPVSRTTTPDMPNRVAPTITRKPSAKALPLAATAPLCQKDCEAEDASASCDDGCAVHHNCDDNCTNTPTSCSNDCGDTLPVCDADCAPTPEPEPIPANPQPRPCSTENMMTYHQINCRPTIEPDPPTCQPMTDSAGRQAQYYCLD